MPSVLVAQPLSSLFQARAVFIRMCRRVLQDLAALWISLANGGVTW